MIRQLTAFGSTKIQNLVRDLLKSIAECSLAVQEHYQARSQQVGSEVVSLWGRVQELRETCANLAVQIEREINRELTSWEWRYWADPADARRP